MFVTVSNFHPKVGNANEETRSEKLLLTGRLYHKYRLELELGTI